MIIGVFLFLCKFLNLLNWVKRQITQNNKLKMFGIFHKREIWFSLSANPKGPFSKLKISQKEKLFQKEYFFMKHFLSNKCHAKFTCRGISNYHLSVEDYFGGHNSQLKTYNSQIEFTTHNWQLTIHNSQLTIHNWQFTTDNSQLTTDNSQFPIHSLHLTIHKSQLMYWNILLTFQNSELQILVLLSPQETSQISKLLYTFRVSIGST